LINAAARIAFFSNARAALRAWAWQNIKFFTEYSNALAGRKSGKIFS